MGILNYTCVLQDHEEGLFKMWYQIIRPKAGGGGNESWCLYATSPDGLVWEKPELGIVEHDGSTRNNILFYEHEGIRGTPSYWVEKGLCRLRSLAPLQDDAAAMGLPGTRRRHGPFPRWNPLDDS